MGKSLRILVCGDVEGHFKQLFTRVATIQKKAGQFDMLFCIGDFFGKDDTEWKDYKSGAAKVPISTYILGPISEDTTKYFPDPDGGDLCENVTFLGRRGLFTGSSGLCIAYLSGLDGCSLSDERETHFTNQDVDTLMAPFMSGSTAHGVDILLTSPWPAGVEIYAKIPPPDGFQSSDVGSATLSQLALCLKPRYHFAAVQKVYYERPPYRNHKVLQQTAHHVTRFLGLADVANKDKKKYLYAFNIVPMRQMEEAELIKQPPDVTECPYRLDESVLNKPAKTEEKAAQFFYDANALEKGQKQRKKRKSDKQQGPREHKKPTGPCWFCLSSPEVEKHLVVSVGTECYVALAKGGLTPDHVLILPIGHHQSTVSAPSEVIEEIDQFKSALKKCFRSHGKAAVFFERNYKTQHLQIQVVPIPLDLAEDVKDTFMSSAQMQNVELHEIPKLSDLKQIVPEGAPYFFAEIPSGEKLLYRIKKGFPLQFGREAMADTSLLNMPGRADWRNCQSSKAEESEAASQFRDSFEKFDFNLT